MTAHARVNVLGVNVSAVDMDDALRTVETWIAERRPHYVCVTGVHGVMESQHDPELKTIHNRAGLVTPDGMPMVWLAQLRGHRQTTRVYGPDLMLELCRVSLTKGYRHFFYGGGEGVADKLAARLEQRFPGLIVAGTYCPPFRPLSEAEDNAVVQTINATAPDIVWVGLSTPKQERWMASHLGRVAAPVMIGVGAAFDFHAGLKQQAPVWMQRSGLEWSFRLMSEPRRLGRRYLSNNPRFVALAAAQVMGLKAYEADASLNGGALEKESE